MSWDRALRTSPTTSWATISSCQPVSRHSSRWAAAARTLNPWPASNNAGPCHRSKPDRSTPSAASGVVRDIREPLTIRSTNRWASMAAVGMSSRYPPPTVRILIGVAMRFFAVVSCRRNLVTLACSALRALSGGPSAHNSSMSSSAETTLPIRTASNPRTLRTFSEATLFQPSLAQIRTQPRIPRDSSFSSGRTSNTHFPPWNF